MWEVECIVVEFVFSSFEIKQVIRSESLTSSHWCYRPPSGLSTARSIGDLHMKRPKEFVTATPDLRIVTVDFNRDQFVVLGSDGIWDVISDQDACDVVNNAIEETGSSQEVRLRWLIMTEV